MRMSINLIIGIVIVALGLVAYGSLFTVNETQQAIVMQFGEPKRVISEPGLSWKIPLLQNVQYYEKRVLNLDPPAENILLTDQKRLIVDRSEEHTSEIQSLMRISYAVFWLEKKKNTLNIKHKNSSKDINKLNMRMKGSNASKTYEQIDIIIKTNNTLIL